MGNIAVLHERRKNYKIGSKRKVSSNPVNQEFKLRSSTSIFTCSDKVSLRIAANIAGVHGFLFAWKDFSRVQH